MRLCSVKHFILRVFFYSWIGARATGKYPDDIRATDYLRVRGR